MYIITHYIKQSPSEQGWCQLPFFCKKPGKEQYYLAYNEELSFDEAHIRDNEEAGYYKRLDIPIKSTQEKLLWISSDSKIWLADKDDPFQGTQLLVDDFLSIKDHYEANILLQLEEYGITSEVLYNNDLPLPIKQSLKVFLNTLEENPQLLENKAKDDEFTLLFPTYIESLNNPLKKIVRRMKEMGLDKSILEDSEEVFEATENSVYYDHSSIFMYPYFLDQGRFQSRDVSVIPYATQRLMAIVLSKKNEAYEMWVENRRKVRADFNLSDLTDSELDLHISTEDGVEWLKLLLTSLFSSKGNAAIHSVRGYVFYSIIQQFANKHFPKFRELGGILKASTDVYLFGKEKSPPFYRKLNYSDKEIVNKVLLLDPADALELSRNGERTFIKTDLGERFDIVYVKHGLHIPVGIGFSIFALPKILKNNLWQELQKIALSSLSKQKDLLRRVGIDLYSEIKDKVVT